MPQLFGVTLGQQKQHVTLLAAGIAAAAVGAALIRSRRRRRWRSAAAAALAEAMEEMILVDCTHELAEGYGCSWPGLPELKRTIVKSVDTTRPPGARNKQAFELNGGLGTHIDAAAHFIPAGRTVDQLTLSELASPAVLIDVENACAKDADYRMTVGDLMKWEAKHGQIPDGAVVLMRTGWAEFYDIPEKYRNITDPSAEHCYYAGGIMHFPGFSAEAAEWLVSERSVAGIGIDTLSPDAGFTSGFPVHHTILGADKFILENLDLQKVPEAGAWLLCLPLKLRGAPEAPIRAIALCPPP